MRISRKRAFLRENVHGMLKLVIYYVGECGMPRNFVEKIFRWRRRGMGRVVVVIINRDLLVSQFHLSVLTPDTGQIVNHSKSNLSYLLKNYSSLDNKKNYTLSKLDNIMYSVLYYNRRVSPLPLEVGHCLRRTWRRRPREREVYPRPSPHPPSALPP